MASVRKRKWEYNGVTKEGWVVEYTDPSGKRRRKKAASKKEADKLRLQIEVEIEGGTHTPDRESSTIREATEDYITDCERRHAVKDRMSGYMLVSVKSSAKKIIERFGSHRVKDLTSTEVQRWIDTMSTTYKRSTIATRYCHLVLVLKHAVRRKWIKRNVLTDDPCSLPRVRDREIRVPTKDQLNALARAVEDRGAVPQYLRNHLTRRAFVYLGVFAGMRRGEVAGLQWENVDFKANVIRVRHSLSSIDGLKSPKSEAGVRDIPMAPQVRRALVDLWRYWTLRERVWANRGEWTGDATGILAKRLAAAWARGDQPEDGDEPLVGYVLRKSSKADFGAHLPIGAHNLGCQHWDQVMTAAGLVDERGRPLFTAHAMRHAHASLLIESGLPAFNLKTLIGHSSVSTTYNTYGHLFPSDGRNEAAIGAIARAFDAPRERQEKAEPLRDRVLRAV